MKRTAQDVRWSKAVREKFDYTCQWPKCAKQHEPNSTGLHAAHIFSRGILRTRHDELNGVALCYPHHVMFDHLSKEDREKFARELIGDTEYESLRERARNPRKRQPCQGEERDNEGHSSRAV